MKNNFAFNLKGRDIMPYVWGIWLIVVLLCGFSVCFECLFVQPDGPEVLDWHWAGGVFAALGIAFLFAVGYELLGFFVVKRTIEGLSLKDAPFETDYDYRRYVWLVLKGMFFSIITLGIYAPWFAAKLMRYFADGVSHRYNYMGFNGRPMTLFGITVLFAVLPSVVINGFALTYLIGLLQSSPESAMSLTVLWIVLIIVVYALVMCIYQTLYYRWLIDFSYGQKRIALQVSWWKAAWFLLGQLFLTGITLGLYGPMFWLRTLQYFSRRMVLGDELVEERFGMTLRSWRDWGYMWCQILLTIITVGVYMPWAYARISNRFFPRCYVEEVEKPSEPMPEQ